METWKAGSLLRSPLGGAISQERPLPLELVLRCSTVGKHPKQQDEILKASGATVIRQEEDPVCPAQGRQATQTTRAQSQNQPVSREGFSPER